MLQLSKFETILSNSVVVAELIRYLNSSEVKLLSRLPTACITDAQLDKYATILRELPKLQYWLNNKIKNDYSVTLIGDVFKYLLKIRNPLRYYKKYDKKDKINIFLAVHYKYHPSEASHSTSRTVTITNNKYKNEQNKYIYSFKEVELTSLSSFAFNYFEAFPMSTINNMDISLWSKYFPLDDTSINIWYMKSSSGYDTPFNIYLDTNVQLSERWMAYNHIDSQLDGKISDSINHYHPKILCYGKDGMPQVQYLNLFKDNIYTIGITHNISDTRPKASNISNLLFINPCDSFIADTIDSDVIAVPTTISQIFDIASSNGSLLPIDVSNIAPDF